MQPSTPVLGSEHNFEERADEAQFDALEGVSERCLRANSTGLRPEAVKVGDAFPVLLRRGQHLDQVLFPIEKVVANELQRAL